MPVADDAAAVADGPTAAQREPLLVNTATRNRVVDQIVQLESFLTQRLDEVSSSDIDITSINQFEGARAPPLIACSLLYVRVRLHVCARARVSTCVCTHGKVLRCMCSRPNVRLVFLGLHGQPFSVVTRTENRFVSLDCTSNARLDHAVGAGPHVVETKDAVAAMLSAVQEVHQKLSGQRLQQLFLIRTSAKYVERLAASLKQQKYVLRSCLLHTPSDAWSVLAQLHNQAHFFA